jgi:uncharacterized protein (TIGR02300 family)
MAPSANRLGATQPPRRRRLRRRFGKLLLTVLNDHGNCRSPAFPPDQTESAMAKPEWGTKRVCLSCGARFYDLQRSPILCPACGATFDAESVSRARRARPAPRLALVPDEVAADVAIPDDDTVPPGLEGEAEVDEEAEVVEAAEEEEDEALIEDASELGEDEDMTGVIDSGLDEDEDHHR